MKLICRYLRVGRLCSINAFRVVSGRRCKEYNPKLKKFI